MESCPPALANAATARAIVAVLAAASCGSLLAACPSPQALVGPPPIGAPPAVVDRCGQAVAPAEDALRSGLVFRATHLLHGAVAGCLQDPARWNALRDAIAARAGTLSATEARAELVAPAADAPRRERALYHLERLGGAAAAWVTLRSAPDASPTRAGAHDVWPVSLGAGKASLVARPAPGGASPRPVDALAVLPGELVAAPGIVTLESVEFRPATLHALDLHAGTMTTVSGAEIHVLDRGQAVTEDGASSPDADITAKELRLVEPSSGSELWRAPLSAYYFADVAPLGARFIVARERTEMWAGVALSAADEPREALGATVYDRATGHVVLVAGGVLGALPDGERLVVCERDTGHTLVVRPGATQPEHVLPTRTCAGAVVTSADGRLLFWGPVRQHDDPVLALDLESGRQWSVPVAGVLPSRWGSEEEASVAVMKGAVTERWYLTNDGRYLCADVHFFVSGGGRQASACPVTIGPGATVGPAPRRLARLDGDVRALPAPLARLWESATGVVELVPTGDRRHAAAVQRDVPAGELVLTILDRANLRTERSVRVPLGGAASETGALTPGDGPSTYRLGSGERWVLVEAATGVVTPLPSDPAPVPSAAPPELRLCLAGHLVLPDDACAQP